MIKCLAIDDEPLALQQIENYIKKVPFLELADVCLSATDAMRALTTKNIDAMFCDINMPDLNGLDFVRSLTNPPLLVFTTAYSNYAIDGYKVNAIDFLLKPFSFEDFQKAANKIYERYREKELAKKSAVADAPLSTEGDNDLYIKTDYQMMRIDIRKIRYIEGMSEYLRIYLEGEEKPVVFLFSMRRMEDFLAGKGFMRVHRSYIVNLNKIDTISRGRIIMGSDVVIPIGASYSDVFQDYLEKKSLRK